MAVLLMISGGCSERGRPAEEGKTDGKREVSTVSGRAAADSAKSSYTPLNYPDDMRGVWVPCMALTLLEDERSEEAFCRKTEGLIRQCREQGLNTIIVQVRPFGDAIYPSELFPWSHILTGEQGKSPGFDPLSCILRIAHENKISVHAWINPLRIQVGNVPPELSPDNPYIVRKNENGTNAGFAFSVDGGTYYDPSDSRARKLIIDGVRELAQNYDIDGLQIDDYFYPSEETVYDEKSYRKYLGGLSSEALPLSQKEWRVNNINMTVAGIRSALMSVDERLVFGISPQGNMQNNEKLCADVESWCRQYGYADYICPQLYVSNSHPVLPFRTMAQPWLKMAEDSHIRLYCGLALYKQNTDADSGTWLTGEDIIKSQKEYSARSPCSGYILYSSEFLPEPE